MTDRSFSTFAWKTMFDAHFPRWNASDPDEAGVVCYTNTPSWTLANGPAKSLIGTLNPLQYLNLYTKMVSFRHYYSSNFVQVILTARISGRSAWALSSQSFLERLDLVQVPLRSCCWLVFWPDTAYCKKYVRTMGQQVTMSMTLD